MKKAKKGPKHLSREYDPLVRRHIKFFECHKCGSTQSWAPANLSGGITEAEAQEIGWKLKGNKWMCPSCQ